MAQPPRHARDRDFAAWALGQARAIREGLFELLDREILANEIERLVSRERSELNRRIEALIVQLLMWTVNPAVRTESLRAAVLESRNGIDLMLRASPSLQVAAEDALPRSYAGALTAVTDLARVAARSLSDFERSETHDLFEKSGRFLEWLGEFRHLGVLQTMYRVQLEGPLDHRIVVRDAATGERRELVCFDSNSYLGLHLHPRVVAATH